MNDKKSSVYYIENLTACSWIFYVLPYFLRNGKITLQTAEQVYYFNNSTLGLWLANRALRLKRVPLQRADFRQGDMRDRDGNLIWMKTTEDSLSIQEDIKNNSEFQRLVCGYGRTKGLSLFLGKLIMCCDLITQDTFLLQKFIFLVRSIERREHLNDSGRSPNRDIFLFMQERPWFLEMRRFVESKGIKVIPVEGLYAHVKVSLIQFEGVKSFIKEACKRAAYCWMVAGYKLKTVVQANDIGVVSNVVNKQGKQSCAFERLQPRMAVEHYGYLKFDSPEMFSDLFFFQEPPLRGGDILIYFGLPKAPIRDKDWNEIRKHGMSAVVINPRASATPKAPLFIYKGVANKGGWFNNKAEVKENILAHKWLQHKMLNYCQRYDYWVNFFKQHNIKIHLTWHKYSPDHSVILDAIQAAGGIGVVYQRSFDSFLAPWTFTTADVVFGFSRWGSHIGRDRYSVIPYYVITGYGGDYRFSLLGGANNVRNLLRSHGAKKILAYFDEHGTDHPRWDLAYKVTLENYSYLLNKVLENPWLGLILKPKVPSTLRTRLGHVAKLLYEVEKTGRCFIFDEGGIQCLYPPAIASLGADVAIHGHLFAATAGIESALAGVPTLFLDSEGIPECLLHKLENGRVIFKNIEQLWRICLEHWNTPGGVPGFADWSGILDELDPFRDGRAAERMRTYLAWLMEGFRAELPRETILADAAERYGQIWGKDKILSVNSPTVIGDSRGPRAVAAYS